MTATKAGPGQRAVEQCLQSVAAPGKIRPPKALQNNAEMRLAQAVPHFTKAIRRAKELGIGNQRIRNAFILQRLAYPSA